MKKFEDLIFKPHPHFNGGKHAIMDFENGYGVSVINGDGSYTSGDTWEIGIRKNGKLCYTTGITDDVLGYQTSDQVTEIMERVQSL